MSFAQYKKNRAGSVDALAKAAEESVNGKKNYNDDRYWKPTVDKDGNASAVIRFLPSKDPNENPWVTIFKHGFKGPTGQWYFELSRTTIGEDDPVGDLNTKAWASGDKGKAEARDRKRKLVYVSNIYVVKDPGNPENEGKVFLYEYGKKIFEKLKDAMTPEFEDETPIIPFDMFDGADFKFRQRKVEGWPNYDKCELAAQGPLSEDEAELERIFETMYNLQDLVDPKNFKSYEELQIKLNRVLCITSNEPQAAGPGNSGFNETDSDEPDDDSDDSDDDSLKYFQNMVDSD